MPRTALIGRDQDLDTARTILADTGARLLTLTGVGGCGKTRLAFELTAGLAPTYPQRVWVIELASLGDPDLLPLVVAETLGLHEDSSTSSLAAVVADVGERPTLLILDNCEHLIDACAGFVDGLLSACPGLLVLATSREPLRIAGERQYRVPPLAVPDPEAPGTVDEIAASPAVRLFVIRAQAVLPAFALTPNNAVALARICARLEGIPLALELAAARVRVLGLEQLLERLDDSFSLLTGGSRVAPTRHQTLRATLEWSDSLLTEVERAVFRRLGVFIGEFQLPAVEALSSDLDIPPDGVLDILTGLVDKSLVMVVSEDREARYRLLEPVRQYAIEQLGAGGEAESIRKRHAAFYLELAEQAVWKLYGSEQERFLTVIDRDQGNFRAAMEWTRQDMDPRLELRLAIALEPFWNIRGHVAEGLGNLRHGLARASILDDPALRARALICAGRLAFLFEHTRESSYGEAEAYSRESLAIARKIGDARSIGNALTNLGMVYRMQRNLDRSIAALEDALVLFVDQKYEFGVALATMHLGIGALIQEDHERGTCLLQESMDRMQAIGNLRFATMAQALLGWQARDFDQAIRLLVDALPVHQRLGDRWFVAWDLLALADVVLAAGYAEQGVRLMGAAQAYSDRLGSPVGGVSFESALAQVDRLRSEDWFEPVWATGYALDQYEAVRLGVSLPDELASRKLPGEPARPDFKPLSPRELEVARLLADGHTDREIADTLFIATGTVGVHVHHILQKLELQSRVQVAGWLTGMETDPSDD